MHTPTDLRSTISDAFSSLTDSEVHLLALAMLHGVPIRQIVDSKQAPERTQEQMITALRKLRKALDTRGHGAPSLLSAWRTQQSETDD